MLKLSLLSHLRVCVLIFSINFRNNLYYRRAVGLSLYSDKIYIYVNSAPDLKYV